MKVNLVWVTPEAEKLLIYMARVSSPKNQNNPKIAGLIRYLIDHHHWSPFELANMCVEIETSRAISAQILRHRSFSFQEFSQRYAPVQEFEPVELRKQAVINRQSSEEIFDPVIEFEDGLSNKASELIWYQLRNAKLVYENLINNGVAKEVARLILPMSSRTRMYMNGSVRSWIHYLNLRTQDDTQKEHRDVANAIKLLFIQQFPTTAQALGWNNSE